MQLQQAEGQLEDLTGQSEATQQEHAAATRRIGELERKLEVSDAEHQSCFAAQ